MALVWDCFGRLGLGKPALSPSSLCYPIRPDDSDGSAAFQRVPNFCHFRPLRNFGVRFLVRHGAVSEMRYHLLVNVYAVGLTSSPKKVVVKRTERCVKTASVQLDVILSLSVSWARLCSRTVNGTQEVVY
jgi:hypothetical protein